MRGLDSIAMLSIVNRSSQDFVALTYFSRKDAKTQKRCRVSNGLRCVFVLREKSLQFTSAILLRREVGKNIFNADYKS